MGLNESLIAKQMDLPISCDQQDVYKRQLEEISRITGLLIFDGVNGVFRQKQQELLSLIHI